jgi:hypothetical protein
MKRQQKLTGLQLVAVAIRLKADTLRARLAYHKIKTRGLSAADLATQMQSKLGHQFTPAQLRKLNVRTDPPPVHSNPRPSGVADVPEGTSNLRLAIMSLRRLEKLYALPAFASARYGERDLLELEALQFLLKVERA